MSHPAKPKLLVLTTDPTLWRHVALLAQSHFDLLAASTGQQAMKLLGGNEPVRVLLASSQLAGERGLSVLEQAMARYPLVRRVLLTEPDDLRTIVEGLHRGVVQHLAYVPIHAQELLAALLMGGQSPLGSASSDLTPMSSTR